MALSGRRPLDNVANTARSHAPTKLLASPAPGEVVEFRQQVVPIDPPGVYAIDIAFEAISAF